MAKPRVRPYPPLNVRDNLAIHNTQRTAVQDACRPITKFYFVVFAAGDQAYPYGVSRAESHRDARDLAGKTHVELGFPRPEVITVIGTCSQERCTCSNAMFALCSERPAHKGRWKHSEQPIFRIGGLRTDLVAQLRPNHVQKHVPLWRAKRTAK